MRMNFIRRLGAQIIDFNSKPTSTLPYLHSTPSDRWRLESLSGRDGSIAIQQRSNSHNDLPPHSTLRIGLPTRLWLGCVEQGGDWALCCLLYNQPFTFYVGLVGAAAFHSSSVEYLPQNTHIQAVSNSCLPRLQAQSFIFLLHCVCICQRRLSDLSSVLIGFRSVRICIYPMCIVTAVFYVRRRR